MADAKKTTKAPAKVAKKANEVKTIEQLKEDLVKAQSDLLDARKSHRQGELVNPHILTTHRKAIARLHTAINSESRKEAN